MSAAWMLLRRLARYFRARQVQRQMNFGCDLVTRAASCRWLSTKPTGATAGASVVLGYKPLGALYVRGTEIASIECGADGEATVAARISVVRRTGLPLLSAPS